MNLSDKLNEYDRALFDTKAGRIAATKYDPFLFAILYLPDHITDSQGLITLSEFHEDVIDYALTWTNKISGAPKANRTCFIAPRGVGKSTWLFTILPLWAAAHGHQKFIAAFADSASQAEEHLSTFVKELENNQKLRNDFPELCTPKTGGYRERAIAMNRSQILMSNGFIFMARGADTSSLGMKVGTLRPTLIILDDIEKGESNYSDAAIQSRLKTVTDDIFMLNEFAPVAIVGTTTKMGSIIDQIRSVNEMRSQYEGTDKDFREALPAQLRWVPDEKIGLRYWPALLDEDTETMRSVWPEKWTLEHLLETRHTRTFAKNMQCRPISDGSDYWDDDDIQVDQCDEYSRTIISVDPAVTTNKKSDYTGISVISRGSGRKFNTLYVRHVEAVKLGPDELKSHLSELIEEYDAKVVLVETNQGGDLWKQLFSGLPAKFNYKHTSIKKEIRAQQALDWYQKNKVKHVAHFPAAEEQLKNFPNVINDDMVDSISSGVNYFLGKGKTTKVSAITTKWN